MSHKPAPVLLMSVMALLVLTISSVAYGQWTQSLYLDGEVSTANFSVEWISAFAVEKISDRLPVCAIDPADATMAIFSLEGGAPGDVSVCLYRLQNNGDLPVIFDSIELAITADNFTPDIELQISSGVLWAGIIYPGETADAIVAVEVLDGADPGNTYTFTLEAVAEQADP